MTIVHRIAPTVAAPQGVSPDTTPQKLDAPRKLSSEPVIVETSPDITSAEKAERAASHILDNTKKSLLDAVGSLDEAKVRALLEE